MVDISYGGENGFNQAIELAAESLANVKFIQEKKLIGKIYIFFCPLLFYANVWRISDAGRYFDEISQDTGKYCFGVDDTLKALELGAVEILICWENLDIMRYMLKIPGTEATKVLHLTPEQQKDNTHFTDKEVIVLLNSHFMHFLKFYHFFFQSGTEMELMESQPLLEWLANNYKSFGATLEIITDKSQEGSQFVRGFGGIGGNQIIAQHFSGT